MKWFVMVFLGGVRVFYGFLGSFYFIGSVIFVSKLSFTWFVGDKFCFVGQ